MLSLGFWKTLRIYSVAHLCLLLPINTITVIAKFIVTQLLNAKDKKMKSVLAAALPSLLLAYLILQGQPSYARRGGSWCVAKPSATEVELTNNINFACQSLRAKNCTQLIEEGGSCREPNILINHASVVMNAYYAENGRNWWNCDFKGTGLIAISNPSYGNCTYE